jgi:hypothetical protein
MDAIDHKNTIVHRCMKCDQINEIQFGSYFNTNEACYLQINYVHGQKIPHNDVIGHMDEINYLNKC